MDAIQYRRLYSRTVLLQMSIIGIVVFSIIIWQLGNIEKLFLHNQLSYVGYTINGLILFLFASGMANIIIHLVNYNREEVALEYFIRNLDKNPDQLLLDVNKLSLINHRFQTMQVLYDNKTPINHYALASTLVAQESTKTSLARFVNNVLILVGVFGTIISLSIALIGASDILDSSLDSAGMGLVIHGMSTAMSTTMMAIGCFLFFGYFYLQVGNVQTNILSAIEQITTTYLSPKFQISDKTIVYEMTHLLQMLQRLVKQMNQSQQQFANMERVMATTLLEVRNHSEMLPNEISEIKTILRDGFRLKRAQHD